LYEELFEKLRILRQEVATAHDLPAKEVFNDYTLSEFAKGRPTTLANIEMISGVSPEKAEQFGRDFLKLIREFLIEQYHNGEKVEGALCLITYKFYEQDLSPEDIAKEQNLPVAEIYEHLVQLYELGHEVELLKFISRQELDHILSTVRLKGNEVKPEEIIAHFEGEYDPFKLKIAWAVYQKMQEGE
jgi:ATP-dependent DNA helicase RecQ